MEWEPFIRLIAAAGFAGVIGLDRELRAKPAGLRTNIVVGVAAGAFTYVGMNAFAGGDPSRVAAQIVSGIGFLGGGAIFAAGGRPHGLTTAAALWGSAAAGLAAGVGAYATGFALVAVTIVTLWPLDWAASSLLGGRRRTNVRVAVVVRDLVAASAVRALLRDVGIRVDYLDMRPFGVEDVVMEFVVHATGLQIGEAFDRLRIRDEVLFISEENVSLDEHPTASSLGRGPNGGHLQAHAGSAADAGKSRRSQRRRRGADEPGGIGQPRRQPSGGPRQQRGKSKDSRYARGSTGLMPVGLSSRRVRSSQSPATDPRPASGSTRTSGTVTHIAFLTSWHGTAPPTQRSTPVRE